MWKALRTSLAVLSTFLCCASFHAQLPAADVADRRARLETLQREITALESELQQLTAREQGVLGELEKIGAELRLREKEYEEATLRVEELSEEIERHASNLSALESVQSERRHYLSFRLREIYKAGPEQALRRVVGGERTEAYWQALSYASLLSERDGQVLQDYRNDAVLTDRERAALEQDREGLLAVQEEAARNRDSVAQARSRQTALLGRIRDDRRQREAALEELRTAAGELSGLVEALPERTAATELDIRKFRGLLETPADGPVSAGFGTVIHPRFSTEVPHPGWDIDAPLGAEIRSVFEGRVVFADWIRGYGLTAIVDHGSGVLSISAHASVLLVSAGDAVGRGQRLGLVGETGSLRGPYLYFELRVDGRAVDPDAWIRRP